MSTTQPKDHYQLENHGIGGWRSLGEFHAFNDRTAAFSDLRMQAPNFPGALRIRNTTTDRITACRNETAYHEQLHDFRDNAVSLRAEWRLAINDLDIARPEGWERRMTALLRQVQACDDAIAALDKI